MPFKTKRRVDDPWESKPYRDRLKALYRRVKSIPSRQPVPDDDVRAYAEWLPQNLDDLWTSLPDSYENKNSRSGYMVAVASALRSMFGEGDERFLKWNREGVKLRTEMDFKTGENKPRDFNITYKELVSRREGFRLEFEKTQKPVDYLKYLVLAVLTMQPPLRSDWGDLTVIDNPARAFSGKNYLLRSPEGYKLVITQDKVAGTSNFKSRADNTIPVTPELAAVLDDSFRRYPRPYAIPFVRYNTLDLTRPLTKDKFKVFLADRVLPDVNEPLDSARSAYATHVYNDPTATYNQKQATAKAMRHSLLTGLLNYVKIMPGAGSGGGRPIGGAPPASGPPAPKPPKDKGPAFNRQAWWVDYSNRNADRIQERQRAYYAENKQTILQKKYLRELNQGNVKNPAQETLDRLGIHKRKSTGEYVARKRRGTD